MTHVPPESGTSLDPGWAGADLPTVVVLDTAVASDNLGDEIIMEAVRQELDGLLDGLPVITVPTHVHPDAWCRRWLRKSTFAVAGGTNLLSSRMWFRATWKVGPLDALLTGPKVVLMGVGWYQYQRSPGPYSRWLLRRLLSRTHLHAVRDAYTAEHLSRLGIENVVNTGCPTLWRLTPEGCRGIPTTKARDGVVTAINSYAGLRDPAADRRLLRLLADRYGTVLLWIQSPGDHDYARSLGVEVRFIPPSVQALDAVLDSDAELDYVGVRLHAGIRALQRGRRALIVEIDNRAREMGRDFGLPTVQRSAFDEIAAAIDGPLEVAVRVPADAIRQWKSQFRTLSDVPPKAPPP